MKKINILFLFIFLCVQIVHGQQLVGPDGDISIVPEYPKAFDDVTVRFETFSFDATRALITWSINNKVVLQGIGETKLKTKVGADGSTTKVNIVAKPREGGTFTRNITLTPSSISLLWEASDSYTPPFYKGKALPPEGGAVRIIAIPSFFSGGKRYDPKSSTYSWSLNTEALGDSSGFGKQVLNSKLNYLENENEFRVIATTLDGTQSADERITIVPTPIKPKIYTYDALFGTHYEKALDGQIEIQKETAFVFEPYFISANNTDSSSLSYTWLLNGLPVTPQEANLITLRPKESARGVGNLEITIEQTKKYLQEASTKLQVVYNTLK